MDSGLLHLSDSISQSRPPQGHKKVPDSEEKQTSSHRHLVAERFNSSHWSFEETWRQGKLSSYKLYF
jgi:hypothetical protein